MLLLLAGTAQSREIASALARRGVAAVASLAGATRDPARLALPTRRGGFGGDAGFEEFLDARGISAVVDATHPFAHRISARTAAIAARRGLPYLQVLRPQWEPGPGDDWTMIGDESEAPAHVAPGATVFLATGRQTLSRFRGLEGCRIICRQIDPPEGPFPFAGGEFLIGRPPFSVAEEEALFRRLGVDWLVVKNAGGKAPASKLVAANRLNIPVLMIRRPPPAHANVVASVAEALDWVAGLP